MSFNLFCRLSSCRRSVRQNVKRRNLSSEYNILRGYQENVIGELRNRLRNVPYLNLLYEGLERIEKDLSYEKDNRLKDALNWGLKVFKYNTMEGKLIRAINLLKGNCTYRFDLDDGNWNIWNSDDWVSPIILAWCVEMLHGYILMLDDIMDQSVLRRGKLCWYKKPEVDLCAINDSLSLENGIYKLLQKNFANSNCYINILHEFFKGTRNMVYGQCLDILHAKDKQPNLDDFTFEKYQTIAEYKADYTFRLPIHLAMHFVGGISVKEFYLTRKICIKLGLYYQSVDDFLDYFGDSKLTGKYGNDIREKKCTWLSVKFLEEASEPMKKHFLKVFGKKDSIAEVEELYKSLNLLERFQEFEKHLCWEIKALIELMAKNKSVLYYDMLTEVQKRKEMIHLLNN